MGRGPSTMTVLWVVMEEVRNRGEGKIKLMIPLLNAFGNLQGGNGQLPQHFSSRCWHGRRGAVCVVEGRMEAKAEPSSKEFEEQARRISV